MRRSPAGFSALLTLAASLVLATPVSAQNDPASRAVRYLVSLQGPDGSIDPGTAGHPNPDTQSETAHAVMGAAAAGLDPAQLRSAAGYSPLDYLAAHSASDAGTADAAAGPTALVILAAVAARQNPRHFGTGDVNLVQRLEVSDKAGAVYGFGDTRAQALGLLGEVASAAPVDAGAVARLRGLQNADGSWNQGVQPGPQGDTDSTAVAVMALRAAAHDVPNAPLVLGFLGRQQNADGGFPFQKPSPNGGVNSNPDSDGLAIQALLALGESPVDPAWTKAGGTPLDNMLSFQAPSGGFRFGAGSPPPLPDGSTTAPLAAAAALQPLPVRVAYPANAGLPVQTAAVTRALKFQSGASGLDATGPAGAVEDTLIGMASAGFDPQTLRLKNGGSAYDYLAANIPSPPSAGATGHLVMALAAGGLDPRSFLDSQHHPHDLVAELAGTYHAVPTPATSDVGSFGDGAVYGDALALLGEAAAGVSVQADFPAAAAYLRGRQHADGSFTYTARLDPTATDGDTNSTSVAVQALDAAGDHGADSAALRYLQAEQSSMDGGFVYSGKPRSTADPIASAALRSDPDSTALVVEALVAMHRNPLGYVQGCATPISYLLGAQDPSGGYLGFSGGPDPFETSQVPQGLERVASPVPNSLVTPGRSLPSASPQAGGVASLSGCDYTPPQDPTQPATGTQTGTKVPARTAARSTVAPVRSVAGPAAPATATGSPPPSGAPVAVVVPTPTAGPVVGGVRGISAGGGPTARPVAAGGVNWPVYALAFAAALALVVLGGLVLRARRSAAGG